MAGRSSLRAILFPARLGQWLGPLIVAGIAAAAVAAGVVLAGLPNLTASTPHPEGWAGFLHYVFRRSVAHHAAAIVPPTDLDSAPRIMKGAVYYSRVCANCHAGPGAGQSPIALAMRPQPQYLVTQVKLYNASELFWIVQHGVKYSAMPAWPVRGREDEVWSIVSFVRQLPKLSPAAYASLAGATGEADPDAAASAVEGHYRPLIKMLPASLQPGGDLSALRPAVGFGRGNVGNVPQQACVQCHGTEGAGRPGGSFPNLTLLNRTTFRTALRDYASGKRASGYMQPVAVQLSTGQIDALANYFAQRPNRPSPQFPVSPATLALGRQIAARGVPPRNVGACQTCHEINQATRRFYPAIAGQNAIYLADQLRLYRAGLRGADVAANPMIIAAKGLSDVQIDAVSHYYARMAPRGPEPVPEEATR